MSIRTCLIRPMDAAAGHLRDDPGGVVDAPLRAVGRLTKGPRPQESRPWGTHHRRLRHGPWRVLCRVDPDAPTLHVEHVGHTGA